MWGEFRSNMRANAPVASSDKSIIASAIVVSQQINVWLTDAENLEPYRYEKRKRACALDIDVTGTGQYAHLIK